MQKKCFPTSVTFFRRFFFEPSHVFSHDRVGRTGDQRAGCVSFLASSEEHERGTLVLVLVVTVSQKNLHCTLRRADERIGVRA